MRWGRFGAWKYFVELQVNPKKACKPWSAAIPNEMSSSIFSPIQTHKREKLEKVSWPLNSEKYLYDIKQLMFRTYFLSIKVSLQRVVAVEQPYSLAIHLQKYFKCGGK